MDGWPVWLVSLSRTSVLTRQKILVPRWPEDWIRESTKIMRDVLRDAGDESRERIFRMNLTICLHRAISQAEYDSLPPSFHEGEAEGIAGGPVAVLWESVPGSASTKPCVNPKRMPLPKTNDLLYGWIPLDCGEPTCDPCMARARV